MPCNVQQVKLVVLVERTLRLTSIYGESLAEQTVEARVMYGTTGRTGADS